MGLLGKARCCNLRKHLKRRISSNLNFHSISISCCDFCLRISLIALPVITILGIWTVYLTVNTTNNSNNSGYSHLSRGILFEGNESKYLNLDKCSRNANSSSRRHNFLVGNIHETFRTNFVSNSWIRISDTVYIYSAHLDTRSYSRNTLLLQNRNLSLIRIIGLVKMPPAREIIRTNPMKWYKIKDETYLGKTYYCRVFKENNETNGKMLSINSHSLTYTIIEEGIKVYSAASFNCYVDLQGLDNHSRIHVALYPIGVENYPDKLIPVSTQILERNKIKNRINSSDLSLSVCVRPLFGPMDDLPKLVTFISYYFSMGVNRFTFYRLSVSYAITEYLRKLSESGRMTVVVKNWNLPTGNVSELWDFGTLAALNDCLYSSMFEDNVIFVDIDEYIVPQNPHHRNFFQLLNDYRNYYQLLIRNTFFCKEFCNNTLASVTLNRDSHVSKHEIFSCTIRTKKVWNVHLRSKYIVNPMEIVSVGHHLVTKYVNQFDHRFTDKSLPLKTNVALLYHYRECRSISTAKHPILNRLTMQDNTILRFKETFENTVPYIVWKENK